MSIADLIQQLSAAGASIEMIQIAVRAVEEEQNKDAARRATQAERKRRSRAGKANGHVTVTGQDEEPRAKAEPVTGQSVTVTRQSADPSLPRPPLPPEPPNPAHPHTPVNPRPPAGVAPKGAATRGSALPTDWQPKSQHFALAKDRGLPETWVHSSAAAMRDWAEANRNRQVGRKADWDRAFSNWLRSEMPKALAAKRQGRLSDFILAEATTPSAPVEPMVDFGGGNVYAERTVLMVLGKGAWLPQWGPKVGEPGCKLPSRLWPVPNSEAAHAA